MSIRERFRKAANGFRLKSEPVPSATPHVDAITGSHPLRKESTTPEVFYNGWRGQPRLDYALGSFVDIREMRRLALSPTAMLCTQRLSLDVQNTQWEIIPLAKENAEKPDGTALEHAKLMNNWLWQGPNDNHEPFMQILSKAVNDILVLDAGLIKKEYGIAGGKYLVQLWASDGGMFWKEIDKFDRLGKRQDVMIDNQPIKNFNVGYWYNSMGEPCTPWEPHEIIYMMQNPRTDIVYGTSKIQTLKIVLSALMYGEEYYEQFFKTGGKGNILFSTAQSLVDILWDKWHKNIKDELGKSYFSTIPADNDAKATNFGLTPDQMKWLETKDEFRHLVMGLFNVTGEVLGFTSDIHKATAESQRSVYIRKGLWPMLKLIEWYINTQVVNDFFWEEPADTNGFAHGHIGRWSGLPIDVMFRFKLFDPLGEIQQLDIDEKNLKNGLTTVNEIRKRNGQSALKWGNVNPMMLLSPQQWTQSWFYQAFTPESWTETTGLPAPAQVTAAVKPETTPAEDVKAYKQSRIEPASQK